MKYLLTGILISVLTAVPLWGVIFASDTVVLEEDGVRISDDRLVMTDSRNPDALQVIKNGTFSTRQSPGPLVFVISRIDTPVLGREEWSKSDKADKTYEGYLKSLTSLYDVVIELPKATDKSTTDSPSPGMTGGTIGVPRSFTVDLKTGKVIEIQARKESASVKSEVSEKPAPVHSNAGLLVIFGVAAVAGVIAFKMLRKLKRE